MNETQYADVNGARLAFDVTGQGAPVVLLHAGLGDRRMWDSQIPDFAEYFTVIRMDARGFGETQMPPTQFVGCADVVGLLDHLGIERAHLVGVSMGSQTAIDVTVTAPDRVATLTAVAARTGVEPSDDLRAGWNHVNELVESGDIDGAVEFELRMWVDGPNRESSAVNSDVRERVRAMNRELFIRTDVDGEEIPIAPPSAERLAQIMSPALILWGDQDVADVQQAGPRLAATIPNARAEVMAGVAHLPNMENPVQFNRLVLEFLLANTVT